MACIPFHDFPDESSQRLRGLEGSIFFDVSNLEEAASNPVDNHRGGNHRSWGLAATKVFT
jgi:hypothetical protein